MTDKLSSATVEPTKGAESAARDDLSPTDFYVLVKRGLFYRQNACGYTGDFLTAWIVTGAVAKNHVGDGVRAIALKDILGEVEMEREKAIERVNLLGSIINLYR